MIEYDIIPFPRTLQFEIRSELFLSSLIVDFTSPNLCLDDVFSLIVGNKEVYSATPGLYFNIHHASDEFYKLFNISEE